jgi:hypothetical protein
MPGSGSTFGKAGFFIHPCRSAVFPVTGPPIRQGPTSIQDKFFINFLFFLQHILLSLRLFPGKA